MRKSRRTALEAWRLRRQMSVQDLADKAGLTEGTVVKLERLYSTRYPPARKTIDALARALRVPSYYLASEARDLVVLGRRDYREVVNGEFPDPWHMPIWGEQLPMEQTLQEAGLNWGVASEPEKDLDDEFLLQSDPLPEAEPNPVNNTRVTYLAALAQTIASCYADAQDTTNSSTSRALVRLAAALGEAAQEFEHNVRQQSH